MNRLNALVLRLVKYLTIHAKEIAHRAQIQDRNTDAALQIWDALLNLEKDVKLLREKESGKRSPKKPVAVIESTASQRPLTLEPLEVDSSTTQTMSQSVESLEETREPIEASRQVEDSPMGSSISQIKTKEVFYFPKNALVSTPLYTPLQSNEILQTSAISNPFDSSMAGGSVATNGPNSPSRRRKARVTSNYPSLDIIRSPMKRQQYANKNTFDESTYSWKPSLITNKYNERFQYPADLAEASKMNAIYSRPEEY